MDERVCRFRTVQLIVRMTMARRVVKVKRVLNMDLTCLLEFEVAVS